MVLPQMLKAMYWLPAAPVPRGTTYSPPFTHRLCRSQLYSVAAIVWGQEKARTANDVASERTRETRNCAPLGSQLTPNVAVEDALVFLCRGFVGTWGQR